MQKFLKKNHIPHLITREPGGTKSSEILRKIILDKKNSISETEEILLLMASRINHINNIIKPALKKRMVVISDRFADSTFVYQGFVNNYGMNKTINLHKIFVNNFLPDKTFLFNLSPSEIIKRLKKRSALNKYDKFDLSFHKKIISGYRKLSINNKRFVHLDGSENLNILHKKIVNTLNL